MGPHTNIPAMDAQPSFGPLAGLKVVDFSRVLAGPHCAKTLLDLGADVVKIEPPAMDSSRMAFPRAGQISGYYAQQNAGKRNISINLNVPGAREVALRLCDAAAVTAMRRSLTQHGQLTALTVFGSSGQLEVLDGFKRARAARALGWPTLVARVDRVDSVEAKLRLCTLHDGRGLRRGLLRLRRQRQSVHGPALLGREMQPGLGLPLHQRRGHAQGRQRLPLAFDARRTNGYHRPRWQRRITPSSIFGQRKIPSSSLLANRHKPVPSQNTSLIRSARLARNT